MDTPIRKYQKQKDYQRHKLFRKMKRRRRAAIEQAKDAPMKQLRRKLKIPKFEDGKDDKPNVFQLADGTFVNSHNEPLEVLDYAGVEDPTKWTYVDKKGNRYTPKATRTLTEGEQFTQRQIENEQNTRPFEFTPYIEGANEGAAAASIMMGFPFNMAGSAYYTAKASRDAYNRNYLGAALNGLGAVTPDGSGILQSVKRFLPKEKTLITAENAASITPEQWNTAYRAAYERGDKVEGQRLWDLWFKQKAPMATNTTGTGGPQRLYHTGRDGITAFKTPEPSARIAFDDPYRNMTWVKEEGYDISPEELAKYNNGETAIVTKPTAVYLSDDLITSKSYLGRVSDVNTTYPLYANVENPYIYIGKGKQLFSDASSVNQLKAAVNAGNDGVFLKNVRDYGPNDAVRMINGVWQDSPSTSVAIFDPRKLKSAEPFTLDDNRRLIDLTDRANFNINDIRYGLSAPLTGGTALLGYNSLGQPIDTYKHGKDSGIHINPKNRGKFNALKKRTGKTTEQLTHSKNPLTRKRAIFAQNAKKWKH